MLQYKIPQDVQREDRIVSFLTMKQLGILAAGGTISYLIFMMLSKHFFVEVWGPMVGFPMLIAFAIAFLKVNGLTFLRWFYFFLEHAMSPRKRIWSNSRSAESEIKAMIINMVPKKKDDLKKDL